MEFTFLSKLLLNDKAAQKTKTKIFVHIYFKVITIRTWDLMNWTICFVNYKSSLDLVCQMYVFGKKVVQQNK